ncbi:pyridoxal phosphate-dependent transferase [Aspergillus avenaceus]|uniref:Pyridoxal phosphate-dependent transferase n=1 Tax=Aspergillus avenaceus TaxID=36643 RepID=A0A5N6TZA3_ASPAV|nr:pyridoxal phosphate-dependent transferase [Aspergillus avenaceus]
MDREQFRTAAHSAVDDIINYFDTVHEQPVVPTIEPGYLRPQIPTHPPEEPEEWSQIQADVDSKIKPGLTHWQSPNFMAFYPATVTYPSILGEMYSAAFNAPAFNWLCSPACTELETIVMDWVAQALGLPECFMSHSENRGGGVLQVSASDTIATMMVVARERRVREQALAEGLKVGTSEYEERLMDLRPRLVALGSNQAHSSTPKGALIAGTRYRSVPTKLENNMEMTGDDLRAVLEQCDRDRLTPYYITLNMGTTSSCALDRYTEIKAVLKEKPSWQRIWVHIDAAYAGSALILDEYKHIAQEFAEGVDSFNFNMHKWLLVNFDASCLFIRNRFDLTDALDITPAYLRNPYSESGAVIDYRNWTMSLGRRFRSLKIWFVMRSYGLTGLKAFVQKGVRLGEVFAGLICSRSDLFEIITKPAFGLTVFRIKNNKPVANGNSVNGCSVAHADEKADAITKEVYELINSRGEIFITSTLIGGIYAIRVVSVNEAAEEKYLQRAFEIIVNTTEEHPNLKYTPNQLSTNSRILVTGATGFIGAHVVDNLLARGLTVRAATRSKKKGEQMRLARPQHASKLEFVEIKDFSQMDVFDDIMDGIDAVIHVASPFTYNTTNNEKELIIPAVNGVKSILSASAKHNVKRVVLTSSFASVIDIHKTPDPGFTYTGAHWNPLTYEEAIDPSTDAVVAYRGSKKFAELEAWNFVARENPPFDLVTLCPPMTFGPVVHPVQGIAQLNESNAVLWSVAEGADPLPKARVSAWIDVRDLAEAHVQALLRPEAGGRRFVAASLEPFSYELAADVIKTRFEWGRETVTENYESGNKPVQEYKLDGEAVSRELGVVFRGFEETVADLVGQVKGWGK